MRPIPPSLTVLATTTAAVVALAGAASAQASWSTPTTFPAVSPGLTQAAVNGAGDTAVAWTTESPVTVHVALVSRDGRRVTRSLWRGGRGDSRADGLTIALDRRGAAVVAWSVRGRLRAAYGPLRGGWSRARLIARDTSDPRIAVARDRTQLLVWTNTTSTGSTGVAWRGPGQRFSAAATLQRPRQQLTPYAPESRTGAAFDSAGTAYLWSTCDGAIRIARPHSRRFGPPVDVTGGRALGFNLSVAGPGRGLASWVDSSCTGDVGAGPNPGNLRTRALRAGGFGATQTLDLQYAGDTTPVAIAGDGGLVAVGGALSSVVFGFDAAGNPQAVPPLPSGGPPLADGAGELLVFTPAGYVARARQGAADESFDRPHPVAWHGAAAAADGTGFAVVWAPDLVVDPATNTAVGHTSQLSIATWRP